MMADAALEQSSLVAIAMANGFSLCVAVYIASNLSGGQQIPTHTIAPEVTGFGASILEKVITFALVFTFLRSSRPKAWILGAIGPLASRLISGASVLASGHFTGGSMNPAYSLGSALIRGSFKNQAAC